MANAKIALPKKRKTQNNLPIIGQPLTATSNNAGFEESEKLRAHIYNGPSDRISKYMSYDAMDADSDISRALDIIAEHCTEESHDGKYFQFRWHTETVGFGVGEILDRHLVHWSHINKFPTKLPNIVRNTIKYGDWFQFRNPYSFELYDIHPKDVQGAVIEKQTLKIIGWSIRNFRWNVEDLEVDTNLHDQTMRTLASGIDNGLYRFIPAHHIIHYSTSEGKIATDDNYTTTSGLWQSNKWPFGNSWLDRVAKSFKERQLMEESAIIHRLQRAPNRNVFFIDTGKARPDRAEYIVERFKNEIIQKRLPTADAEGNFTSDGVYNPMSQLDDIFIPVSFDQQGSKIERLEGQAWTDIPELDYFKEKVAAALRVPYAWLQPNSGAINNDAKSGVATQEEVEFSRFCSRVQKYLVENFDQEFKKYCIWRGLSIVWSDFSILFNPPTDYQASRDRARLGESVETFKALIDVPFISKRYAMSMALGWSEDEIAKNERMLAEETHGEIVDTDINSFGGGGVGSMGIKPLSAHSSNFDDKSSDNFDGDLSVSMEPRDNGGEISVPLTQSFEDVLNDDKLLLEDNVLPKPAGDSNDRYVVAKRTRDDKSLNSIDPIRRRYRFRIKLVDLQKYRIKNMAKMADWKRRKRMLTSLYVQDR